MKYTLRLGYVEATLLKHTMRKLHSQSYGFFWFQMVSSPSNPVTVRYRQFVNSVDMAEAGRCC